MSQAEYIVERYGSNLGRPLRYVQLNSFYNGSTGSIMLDLHRELEELGVESYAFWGRRHKSISNKERCVATSLCVYMHGTLARLTDRAGFYSKADTRRLLTFLNEINPDVVHLHNIHGYWVNIRMLFDWLANSHCQVRWTLHDCWSFTGHCPHFQYVGCERWRDACRDCPQKSGYPTSFLLDQSARNYEEKRHLFTSVPKDRMTIICPSKWLADLVGLGFLHGYPLEVRRNEINRSVFRPTQSCFRDSSGVGSRFMILGVASPWSEKKGLDDFFQLAHRLNHDRYAVVLIGLTRKQIKDLPEGVVGFTRTDSRDELAGIYSSADIFFNPTREDNLPSVNLEAEACGTPVWTYDTGGCRETIGCVEGSRIVSGVAEVIALLNEAEGVCS